MKAMLFFKDGTYIVKMSALPFGEKLVLPRDTKKDPRVYPDKPVQFRRVHDDVQGFVVYEET